MKYKAVIFDLDGTLVYTLPEHRQRIVGSILEGFGRRATDESIERFWFDWRREETILTEFGVEPRLFWKEYSKYDSVEFRKNFTKAYEDSRIVEELKLKGYKTGIVTSAPKHIAEFEAGLVGREYFDEIVSANSLNGIRQKPHPEGLELCADRLGVSPEQAVFVGNGIEDMIAAREAGMLGVLIERGDYNTGFENEGIVIESLYELRGIL